MRSIHRDAPQQTRLDRAYEEALAIRRRNDDIEARRRKSKDLVGKVRDRVGGEAKTRIPVVENRVGILFVHGIGTQPPGETLTQWAASIIRALVAWQDSEIESARIKAREEALAAKLPPPDPATINPLAGVWHDRSKKRIDPVMRASLDFVSGTKEYVDIQVPGIKRGNTEIPRQHWIMTEVWWASALSAPPLEVVLDWSTRQGVLGNVVRGIANNGARSGNGAPSGGNLLEKPARLGMTLFLSLASSMAVLGYLSLRTLAAVLPIQALKDSAVFRQFDSFLLSWWGDAYLLLRDPVQSANVRAKIHEGLLALRAAGCGSIVIVSHSGGTMASYMTLGDPQYKINGLDAKDPAIDDDIDRANNPRVTKLITHGEAINLVRPFAKGTYESADVLDGPAGVDRVDRLEPGLKWEGRWVDFWGSHDPAPNGPLTPESGARDRFASKQVWNRRSVREDHGMYMANDEEFVMPLLRELDTPDGDEAGSRFRDPCNLVTARRQRVHVLTLWRRVAFLAPFAAVLAAVGMNLPNSGLDQLVNAAHGLWTWVPNHDQIQSAAEGITGLLAPWFWWLAGGVAMVTLAIITLGLGVHAVLPIRLSDVWDRHPWTKAAVVVLDWLPVVVAVTVALLVAAPLVLPFLQRIDIDLSLSPIPLIAIALLILTLAAMTAGSPGQGGSAEALAPGSQRRPSRLRRMASLGMLILVTAVLTLTLLALVAFGAIRDLVLGAVLAFLVFRPLVGYGARRWERWDARERYRARQGLQPGGRRIVTSEAVVLLALAVLTAIGLAQGHITLPLLGETRFIALPTALFLLFVGVNAIRDAERIEA